MSRLPERGVLLEEDDVEALLGQEQSGVEARWAPAHHDDVEHEVRILSESPQVPSGNRRMPDLIGWFRSVPVGSFKSLPNLAIPWPPCKDTVAGPKNQGGRSEQLCGEPVGTPASLVRERTSDRHGCGGLPTPRETYLSKLSIPEEYEEDARQ